MFPLPAVCQDIPMIELRLFCIVQGLLFVLKCDEVGRQSQVLLPNISYISYVCSSSSNKIRDMQIKRKCLFFCFCFLFILTGGYFHLWFLEIGREGEGGRRETHTHTLLPTFTLIGAGTCSPGICPWPDSNLWPF